MPLTNNPPFFNKPIFSSSIKCIAAMLLVLPMVFNPVSPVNSYSFVEMINKSVSLDYILANCSENEYFGGKCVTDNNIRWIAKNVGAVRYDDKKQIYEFYNKAGELMYRARGVNLKNKEFVVLPGNHFIKIEKIISLPTILI